MSSTHKAKTLQGHTRPIKHIKFSKDGIYVFSASADRTIIKWDYINNKKSFIYNHQASVNVICISNSNKYMFSGDSTGCIYVWDINTNELKKKISFDVLYNIPSLNISSDEFYIIVTLAERSAKRTSFVGIYLTKDIISNNLPPPPNPGNIQLTPLNTFSIENSPAPNLYKKIECPEINTKFSKSCFAN